MDLLILLEKQKLMLTELHELSLAKTKSLMDDDLDALEVIVRQEEVLSNHLMRISLACAPQVQFFLKGNFSELELPVGFNILLEEIRQTLIRLKLNNDLNQSLIRDSLSLIRFTINSFLPWVEQGEIYGATGQTNQLSTKYSMLDCKG